MSLSAKSIEQLFKEGIAAARNQDNATARSCFRDIVKRDDNNEKGWLWLASVLDDPDEKRASIEKVLQINPNNESAKREMMALLQAAAAAQSRAQDSGKAGNKKAKTGDATDSGTKRRISPLILVALVVILALVLVVVVIKPGGDADNGAAATISSSPAGTQAGTQAVTGGTESAVALNGTGTSKAPVSVGTTSSNATLPPSAVAVVATAATGEANATSTIVAPINTLPPSWTPLPSITAVALATYTPLARPPTGLTGHLLVATGTILTTDAFLSIVSMKPDGTESTPIVSDPDRGEYAIYTPDGKYVIYVSVTSGTGSRLLNIANRDGSKPRLLGAAWGNLPALDIRSSLSVSANGRYLAFSGLNILQNEADPAVYVVDMQPYLTGKLILTATPTPRPVKPNTPLPSGSTPSATPSLADLYLTRLTASNTGASTWPAISPDGKTVIYANQSPNSATPIIELFSVPVKANSDPVALTTDGATLMKSAPVWSADGKYVAFTSTPLDNTYSDIEIMLADGTGRHVLLHQGKVHNIRPHWSPDNKYIAFTSDRSGANEVYLVNISTTIAYQVTNNGKSNFVNDWSAN